MKELPFFGGISFTVFSKYIHRINQFWAGAVSRGGNLPLTWINTINYYFSTYSCNNISTSITLRCML